MKQTTTSHHLSDSDKVFQFLISLPYGIFTIPVSWGAVKTQQFITYAQWFVDADAGKPDFYVDFNTEYTRLQKYRYEEKKFILPTPSKIQ